MDLIYTNIEREDVGVMFDYTLDLAYGSSENNFECKIFGNNHCCESNCYLYFENTEYGGIIDDIGVDTEKEEVTYYGRTWHGILNSKIIEPDAGQDYLVLSGEANLVLLDLIKRMGLSELFTASENESRIEISNYQMNRYIGGYDGIRKMLRTFGGKLNISFRDGLVELSAKSVVDYSEQEEFDASQLSFRVKKAGNPLNHIICLGKGELAEREVIHVYADEKGNISDVQVMKGIREVSAVYENTNAESSEELKQGGIDKMRQAWNSNELEYGFDSNDENYDIGDIVGAREETTETEVRAEISKKIVTVQNKAITVSYEVGE